MQRIHEPARAAFAAGDETTAMRFIVDGLATAGRFDSLSPESRLMVMQNAAFFKMMVRSENPYPDLSRDKVWRLKMPVLVITGEKTVAMHREIDGELARLIPRARSSTIPNAGHGSPRENAEAFTQVVENFLATTGL